jgi:hypothetical protein
MDRPKYQDGLAAFDLWATLYDRWALIAKAGKADRLSPDLPRFARNYAGTHHGARCYARDYVERVAEGAPCLEDAAAAYSIVATALQLVWEHARALDGAAPAPEGLEAVARSIREAKVAEEAAVEALRRHLDHS